MINSVVGEITNHTNSADGFALLLVPWAIGNSFGYESYHFCIFRDHSLTLRDMFCHRARRSAGAGRVKMIYHPEQPDRLREEVCCGCQRRYLNFDRLGFVAERAELGEGREALLSVDIPERPGRHDLFLYLMCLSANILPKVSLHYAPLSIHVQSPNSCISGDWAHVLLSFKLQSNLRKIEVKQLLAELAIIAMQGFDISDDELAKSHVRYMIGGCP